MKETISHQLANRVRLLRRKQKITQEQLAARSHISLKYIQRIEGKTPPNLSLKYLQNLSEGFDIPLWKMLKFD